jgi:hypothetical protein
VLPAYDDLVPWQAPEAPVPPYPVASNLAPHGVPPLPVPVAEGGNVEELREELRRLIIEELTTMIRG